MSERNSAPANGSTPRWLLAKRLPRLGIPSRVVLAMILFAAYTAVAASVGLTLFTLTGVGTETTTTTQRDAAQHEISSTVQTKNSTPALVVFTALAAGGWLLIPLRFVWDELAKSSDDRRAIATTMHTWCVFPSRRR